MREGRVTRAALAAAALLAACASVDAPEPLYDPGAPSPELAARLRAAEAAYREEDETYPTRRSELAADPLGACWLTRLFVRDILVARESRDLGVDHHLLRTAAKIDDRTETRAFAELDALGAAAVPCVVADLVRSRQTMLRDLGTEIAARIGAPMLPALHVLARDGQER